jgi:hypothetical protein
MGTVAQKPGMISGRGALFLLSILRYTDAALYSLQDLVRPGVSSDGLPIQWWEGGPAYNLASAGAVRINFRAIYTYPPTSTLRALNVTGWHGVKCNISAWGLCSAEVGHVFPWKSPRMPERSESLIVDGWRDLQCTSSTNKILVSTGVYDISACDIFDEGLDLLYAQGNIYHRHNTLESWEYWTLVILAIVLVRFLSYNIQALWAPKGELQVQQQWPALLSSGVVVAVILADGDSLFVTTADQVFYWSTIAYILLYLVIHFTVKFFKLQEHAGHELPVYNVIVASLQLVASRFYAAAETPYNLVLIGILACRTW